MEQHEIIEILNRHVFADDKAALITKIAQNPDRFVGLFRSTTPGLKLMQNLLQSREIRFGDALENIITQIVSDMGYINLNKRVLTPAEDNLAYDQYFCSADRSTFYLVEQKVRDDHDSTKKRGQIDNFSRKLSHVKSEHAGKHVIGIMYFIDPTLHKNQGYYVKEIEKLTRELELPIFLFYNGDLFNYLVMDKEPSKNYWELLISSLQTWRSTIPTQIDLNYDRDPEISFEELKKVETAYWKKLLVEKQLWDDGILKTLFSTGETLRLIESWFRENSSNDQQSKAQRKLYSELADQLTSNLRTYYST